MKKRTVCLSKSQSTKTTQIKLSPKKQKQKQKQNNCVVKYHFSEKEKNKSARVGVVSKNKQHHHTMMKSLSLFAFFCIISVAAASTAYPSVPGLDSGDCGLTGDETLLVPPRREVYDAGRIFDISHKYTPELPVWESKEGLANFLWLAVSMKNGSRANGSAMQIGAHTGTHVDAPGHFYDNYFDAGFDVDSLDLRLLNGLTLLVDVPRDTNITAEVMKSLNIPKGVSRVLFRTLNTDRRLMFKKEFDTSYVGFMEDGAKWLVENTDIKLVGVDYLSAAAYVNSVESHLVFLESREIILVEGLKLDGVPAGLYSLNCLPLRLVGSEASPIRCILIG